MLTNEQMNENEILLRNEPKYFQFLLTPNWLMFSFKHFIRLASFWNG